jgi:hypothetical protein
MVRAICRPVFLLGDTSAIHFAVVERGHNLKCYIDREHLFQLTGLGRTQGIKREAKGLLGGQRMNSTSQHPGSSTESENTELYS